MYKRHSLFLYILLSFFLSISLKAQNDAKIFTPLSVKATAKQNRPKIIHPDMRKINEDMLNFVKASGNYVEGVQPLKKTNGWNFIIGSTHSWYSVDYVAYETSSDPEEILYAVPSTCRAVGDYCYVFVEDAMWGDRVTQTTVDSVRIYFDSKTPADPNKGIYQTDIETFGNPPNVDGDDKIIILIQDIKDGSDGNSYVAGYFTSWNETTNIKSNKAEIYFLDADPADLTSESGLYEGLSTTAHEFQHMIHYNYDQSEATFINEGCSEVASVVNGFDLRKQGYFNNDANQYLLVWRDGADVLGDYSRASRFFLYLKEQFGTEILSRIVKSNLTGIFGINDALSKMSTVTTRRFPDILEDWLLANYLNDTGLDSRWGYLYPEVGTVTSTVNYNSNASKNDGVSKLAAQYITYKSGANFNINFDLKGNKLLVKAIKKGAGSTVVEDITGTLTYSVPDLGSVYDEVTFIVMQTDNNEFISDIDNNKFEFSYTSTGDGEGQALELSYDNGTPVGVFPISVSDTVCVYFDGVPGAKLDSIQVALRQAGSMSGGIWEYSGVQQPTPLGKKITDIKATSTIAERPTSPYPEPWPNWVTIDVTSQSIDASKSFAAAFVIDGEYKIDGTGANRIMHCEVNGSTSYHSYTYLHNPPSGVPNWYYFSGNTEGTVALYLIRAYVSISGTTGTEEVVELLPANYNLEPNYPNPFNPSTKIRYSIPQAAHVKLTVYNINGEKVTELVNTYQNAGTFETTWHGKNKIGEKVVSGVYFYTLQTGNFLQTKKMILLK